MANFKSKGLAGMGRDMTQAGQTMSRNVTVPVIAAAGAAVFMGVKFEESMKLIQTQANGSAGDVRFLSAEVLKLGAAGQHGPDELANALYHLKSVGMDNADAMAALTASEHLASVGNADLEATTNAVAGAFKSGIKGAQDFDLAAATINATIGAGNLRMDDLTSAMGTGVLVTAKQFGISLTDVGSALAMMTSRGIPATRAATAIKMALSGMAAPTAQASKVMGELKLKSDDLANAMRSGGLPAAIELLKTKLSGLTKTEQTTALTKMFGARSSQAVLTLIGNTKDYAKVQKQVEDNATSGKFGEAIAAQAEDAGAKLKHLYASLKTAAVQFGDVMLPVVTGIVEPLGRLMESVGKMPDWEKKIVIGAGLIAAAIGPLLITFGKVMTGADKIRTLFGGGKLAGALKGGIGTFAKDSSGKTVAQSLLGGGGNATLEGAISLNTTATEANTLALGGKGALPGGGGGPVATIAKTAGMSAAAATGVTIGTFAAMSALPLVLARTQKAVDASMSVAEKRSVGSVGGGAFWGSSKGFHGGAHREAATAGKESGQAFVDGFNGASIARSFRATGDKAGAGLASGLARGVGPALQSIQKVRNSAGRPIHMGHLDATQMLNEIARVSRAFGGISSAARTASNAAANAIGAKSGVQSQSYRGYFMAAGGYVPARPGGTQVVLGEGGEGETVTPDSKMGRGGTVLNINVANVHGTDRAAATKLANMAGEIFMQQVRFA